MCSAIYLLHDTEKNYHCIYHSTGKNDNILKNKNIKVVHSEKTNNGELLKREVSKTVERYKVKGASHNIVWYKLSIVDAIVLKGDIKSMELHINLKKQIKCPYCDEHFDVSELFANWKKYIEDHIKKDFKDFPKILIDEKCNDGEIKKQKKKIDTAIKTMVILLDYYFLTCEIHIYSLITATIKKRSAEKLMDTEKFIKIQKEYDELNGKDINKFARTKMMEANV